VIDEITRLRAAEAGLPVAESHPDPPLHCFPLRMEWDMLHAGLAEIAWPDPETTSTQIGPPYLGKSAVSDLVKLCAPHGWTVRVTHARGCYPSIGGRPSEQKDSLAVRLSRGRQRAVAVYVGGSAWSWDTLYRWTLGEFPDRDATIGAFQDALFGPLCKPAWPGPKDWSCPWFGPVHGPAKPARVR